MFSIRMREIISHPFFYYNRAKIDFPICFTKDGLYVRKERL